MVGRSWAWWPLVPFALLLSGCTLGEWLTDNRLTWLWVVLPLAGFLFAGGVLAHWRRLLSLEDWRLDGSPLLPDAGRIYRMGLLIWFGIVVLFGVANLLVPDHDSHQVILNTLGWFSGALVGSGLGMYFGVRQAEKRYASQTVREVTR